MKRGVRQGGILSAHLFAFYLDEILKATHSTPAGCRLGLNTVNIMAYVDDVVLLSPTSGGLRQLIYKIGIMLRQAEQVVNVDKTVIMIFSTFKKLYNFRPFYLYGSEIKLVDECKYLGVVLNSSFSDKQDMERFLNSFNKQFGILFRMFGSADFNVSLRLYNAFCTSFYGCELWFLSKRCSDMLGTNSIVYHAAFKKLLGLPKRFSNHVACKILRGSATFGYFFLLLNLET